MEAVIDLGSVTTVEIANAAELSRSKTYKHLDRLDDEGHVTKDPHANGTMWTAAGDYS